MVQYKLSADMVKILNDRMADEYKAMYFYQSAADWCENIGYTDAAEYFRGESKDELGHAEGIQKFLTDWNILPLHKSIDEPESFDSLEDTLNKAYELEYDLCEKYKSSAEKAFGKDLNVFRFLNKYIEIQNDSVSEYSTMLNKVKLYLKTDPGLVIFEHEIFEK